MIAVYGGSFNPPTVAHYNIAEHLIDMNYCSDLIFLPVGDYYNKPDLIGSRHRIKMLEILCEKLKNCTVSGLETKYEHFIGTVNILDYFKKKYPYREISFVLGKDNLFSLSSWIEVERLLSQYKILVITRYKNDVDEIVENDPVLSKYRSNIIFVKDFIPIDISSSEYRKINRDNYVLPEVNEYIYKHNLYNRKVK